MLIRHLNGYHPPWAASDALRAVSALESRTSPPGLVAYLPVYRGNPYQSLLYSALPAAGMHAAPIYDAKQAALFADAIQGSAVDLVVHVHWLNSVTKRTRHEETARAAAKTFIQDLSRAKDHNARLLWTVHNVLPHDTRFTDVDVELRTNIADLADRIHVMSPRTRELCAPWFDIPDGKIFVIPHPSYKGAYPNWMSREQARLRLGIPADAVVLLLIGAIKPYKGLTELMDAFDQLTLAEPGRFVLLVAGQPDGEEETQEFCQRAAMHPAVLSLLQKIPVEEMQVYLKAADVGVFPYRRSLNSGALSLALTFDLPVILPMHSGEVATVEPSYAELYDPSRADGLLTAMSNGRRFIAREAREAAAAAARRDAAPKVAHKFAAELRNWLAGSA